MVLFEAWTWEGKSVLDFLENSVYLVSGRLPVNGPTLRMPGYPKTIIEVEEDPDEGIEDIPRVALEMSDLFCGDSDEE